MIYNLAIGWDCCNFFAEQLTELSENANRPCYCFARSTEWGPPIVVVRLAAELATQGHEVRVISHTAADPISQARIEALIDSLPGASQVRYLSLAAPNRFGRFFPGRLKNQLNLLLGNVDFLHLHGVWDPVLKAAATFAFHSGIPYAIAPHGMLDPWSLAQKSWKKKLALFAGYRAMLNRASFMHLLNADEKALIQVLGLVCGTQIIPNGIYPQEFEPLPPRGFFTPLIPSSMGKPYILFLSRLHYKKGLDYLAAAFAKIAPMHPDVQLVVAGPDDGAGEPFRQLIQAAGLQHRVHMVGPIFNQDRYTAIVDAVCFCLPSRQEGFSIAILEAMACGRPVIITDACHFPEVATSGAGEVVSLDVETITAALHRILSDPQRSEQMGKTGRNLVMTQYTWPTIAAQLVDAYQRGLELKIK